MDRISRLDALPFTREHRKLLFGSGAGWALDALDVGLISFVIAALAQEWGKDASELGIVASAGFLGMAIGASLGGLLADRFGRRQIFAITLLIFGLATGASALAGSVAVLVVLRFIVGLGLGAELPVASTLVSEFAPPRIRGRIIVLLEAFWAVGWMGAALIGYLVVPASDNGWRWALAIGAIPAIYAAVIRFGMPESVRFLESRGRHLEAENTVRRFERSAGIDAPALAELPAASPAAPAASAPAASTAPSAAPSADAAGVAPGAAEPPIGRALTAGERLRALFAPVRRGQTIGLWLVWFCVNFSYYGAFVWLPTILMLNGFSLVKSFGFTLIMTLAQLPGYAVSAYLVEKWGRNRTLSLFLVGSALAAGCFALAAADWQIIAAGMLLSFFNLGAWGALYAITPELYPTDLRGTGAGWAAGFGRIASIIAPLLVPLISAAAGTGWLFALFAAVFLVAAVAANFLSDRRGRSLDDFAPAGAAA